MNVLFRFALSGLLASALLAPRAGAQIVGAPIYVATTGEVIATYQGNTASYSNDLYLDAPTNGLGIIFNNHATPVGTSKSLGTFTAGTELVFRLHVNNTGNDFYTGAATRNPDGMAHARVTENWQPGTTLVEFEDLLNGPFVYNDLSFSFTNTSTTPGAIPEPGTVVLMATGALPFLGLRRRRPA